MYRVVEAFEDIADGRHPYRVGDAYPRDGFEPTEERIKALSGSGNVRKRPLIAEERKKPEAGGKGGK